VDDQSNQKLKSAIATGELSARKDAVAKEILRRRYTEDAPTPIAMVDGCPRRV
jgi:hypothetical protein